MPARYGLCPAVGRLIAALSLALLLLLAAVAMALGAPLSDHAIQTSGDRAPSNAFDGRPDSASGHRTPAASPVRLLVLGDSLSAGYGVPSADGFEAQLKDALAAAGYPVTIQDGAVSGDTTAGGRARLAWVLGAHPQAAIVELGGNDGLRALPASELETNLSAILDALAARHIPVLLAGMYAPPNLGPAYEKAFRAVFNRLGARPVVIYYPFFLAGVAANPKLNQPDQIHPNARGVRVIVAGILPDVEKLLREVRKQ